MVKLSGEMGEHTQEPWRISRNNDVVDPWGSPVGLYRPHNMPRIVACVNACRGVTTETLVKYGTEFPEVVADDITDRKRADAAEALLWRIRSLYGAGADPEKWDENEVDLHDEIRTFLAKTAPAPVKPGDEGEG